MKKLNLLLSIFLLTSMTACMVKWLAPEPQSNLRAITDGRLTLGTVASTDEASGMAAYRLLLCKKSAARGEQHFNDRNFCQPALHDNNGAEVVLLPNTQRRSFGYKYVGYAAGLAAAVLTAVGVRQGVKWGKTSTKYIDDTAKSAEKVIALSKEQDVIKSKLAKNKDLIEDVKRKIAAKSDEIAKSQQQSEAINKEIAQLQEELGDGLARADAQKVKGVIKKAKTLHLPLGNELEAVIYGSSGYMSPELLDTLAKNVENMDKFFAEHLRNLKTNSNFFLGDDGVLFYRETYENIFIEQHKLVMEELAKNTNTLLTKKPTGFLDDLLTAVTSRREGALLFDAANDLHYLENLHTRLYSMDLLDSNWKAKSRQLISELQKTNLPIDADLAARLGIDTNADFSTKFRQIKAKYEALAEDDYFALLNPDANLSHYNKHVDAVELEELYMQGLGNFNKLRLEQEMVKLPEVKEADGLTSLRDDAVGSVRRAIKRTEDGIIKGRERLLTLEAARVETKVYAPTLEDFRVRINRLFITQSQHGRGKILELRDKIDEFKQAMKEQQAILNKHNEMVRSIGDRKRGLTHLEKDMKAQEKILNAHNNYLARIQKQVNDLEVQLKNAEQGEFDEIKRITEEMEQNKALWKKQTLATGGGAVGLGATAAVALAIDESIWGNAEQAIGKEYWQQIFAADKGFANPLPVSNLPEIVRLIAQVFGKNVNQSAFDLR